MGWIQAFWYRGTLICEKLAEIIDLVIGYKKAKRFYNGHQQSDFDDKSKIGIDRKYTHFCASRYYLTHLMFCFFLPSMKEFDDIRLV